MIISHKYRFIFIKTRRCATSSIEKQLTPCLGSNDVTTFTGNPIKGYFNPVHSMLTCIKDIRVKNITSMGSRNDYFNIGKISKTFLDLLKKYKFYNHMPAIFVKNRIPNRIWNEYFKFTVERNPWDKAISFYYTPMSKYNNTFREYLECGLLPINY